MEAFQTALSAVGYDFTDETDNAAFKMFQGDLAGAGEVQEGAKRWPWSSMR